MTDYEVTPPPDRLADRVQLRIAFSTERGEVTQFMIQLEYWLEGDWCEVVRYDHDRDAPGGHDITEEGLHRDVYREGKKIRSEDVSPPIPANEGFDAAEEDLRENVEGCIKRFEKWHEVKDKSGL
ncbi:DUF7718 family protein [Halorubrum trueperi]|uniref:DUF7718 domain-containing protein n=1 Tax=Halorubrum trueperi TaxID=2004704 RepID=A0ABD5UEX8_9EURY